MKAAGKRIGRPIKPALKHKRVSLGLKVTAKTKALIESLAQASGRTQSQEAEFLIERCLQYDETLRAMRRSVELIAKGNIENALHRAGWRPMRALSTGVKTWAPPGSLGIEPDGFTEENDQ